MNKTRMLIVFFLFTALMVTACTLEGDIEEVLEKAGIKNDNIDNPYSPAVPSGVIASAESSSRITISRYGRYHHLSRHWTVSKYHLLLQSSCL